MKENIERKKNMLTEERTKQDKAILLALAQYQPITSLIDQLGVSYSSLNLRSNALKEIYKEELATAQQETRRKLRELLESGASQTEVAKSLGWSRGKLVRVLSVDGPLPEPKVLNIKTPDLLGVLAPAPDSQAQPQTSSTKPTLPSKYINIQFEEGYTPRQLQTQPGDFQVSVNPSEVEEYENYQKLVRLLAIGKTNQEIQERFQVTDRLLRRIKGQMDHMID